MSTTQTKPAFAARASFRPTEPAPLPGAPSVARDRQRHRVLLEATHTRLFLDGHHHDARSLVEIYNEQPEQ